MLFFGTLYTRCINKRDACSYSVVMWLIRLVTKHFIIISVWLEYKNTCKRVDNILEVIRLLCLFWQRKFKAHLPGLASRVHPASDFFCVFSTICPNQLGQELPEGLQNYLGKSHACNLECCRMVLDHEGLSVQSSHLSQLDSWILG